MLKKSVIAISAVVVLSSASAVLAVDDAENNIGDRYPSLAQNTNPTVARSAGNRVMVARQVSRTTQVAEGDAENQISDRYPSLAQSDARVATTNVSFKMPTIRFASSNARFTTNEPEYQIGDKYPLLERADTRRSGRFSTAGRLHKQPKNKA